ncbi:MAG: ferritin family protein [Rhodospirillaceae bacterium]
MTRLNSDPGRPAASLDDLMAIAAAMEAEAVRLYRALADTMDDQGAAEVAAVFRRLVAMEEAHVVEVGAWSRSLIGAPPPSSPAGRDDVWSHVAGPAADEAATCLLTPYQALSIAVRTEERAFAYYSYVAAGSDDAAVCRVAETLAGEELRHAAELRIERRRAWRRQQDGEPVVPLPIPDTLAAFSALAAALEEEASASLGALRLGLEREAGVGDHGDVAILSRLADQTARRAAEYRACGEGSGTDAAAYVAAAAGVLPRQVPPATIIEALRATVRLFERLCDLYGTIAERSRDEAILNAALVGSEQALADLTQVRERLRAAGPDAVNEATVE